MHFVVVTLYISNILVKFSKLNTFFNWETDISSNSNEGAAPDVSEQISGC